MTVNIASPEHKSNPYPFYAHLRAESPVHRIVLPDKQSAWLVTRYDDVAAVLKDQRFGKSNSSAKQPWVPGFVKPLTRNMLDLDEPDHTRLRALVSKAFTPGRVEQMRDRIQTLTDDLLTAAQKRGHFDLIRDYALPISARPPILPQHSVQKLIQRRSRLIVGHTEFGVDPWLPSVNWSEPDREIPTNRYSLGRSSVSA